MTSRICRVCSVAKPAADFYPKQAACKDCDKIRNKDRRRGYYRPEGNWTASAKARKAIWYKEKHDPFKQAARFAVRNAIQSGRLVRPSVCSECKQPAFRRDGATAIQAHHYLGHEHPLMVVFLCPKCHADEHKAARARGEE